MQKSPEGSSSCILRFDLLSAADRGKRAYPAFGASRRTQVTAEEDEQVMPLVPAFPGQLALQLLFHLAHIILRLG